MRNNLGVFCGERKSFIGTFKRYGRKSGWNGVLMDTVLLVNIRCSYGNLLADHIWFNLTKGFEDIGELKEGDIISFCARVEEYEKGYVNDRKFVDNKTIDYRLSRPNKIRKVF